MAQSINKFLIADALCTCKYPKLRPMQFNPCAALMLYSESRLFASAPRLPLESVPTMSFRPSIHWCTYHQHT